MPAPTTSKTIKQGFQKGHVDFVPIESRKIQGQKMLKHMDKPNYFQKGNIPWFIKQGLPHPRLGKGGQRHSLETKIKMSSRKQKISPEKWVGFLREAHLRIRRLPEYKIWRNLVFQRDNYTCLWCGDSRGGNLHADHIKPFSLILKQNKVRETEQAIVCSELWDISNGRTLCKKCHQETDTFGFNATKLK